MRVVCQPGAQEREYLGRGFARRADDEDVSESRLVGEVGLGKFILRRLINVARARLLLVRPVARLRLRRLTLADPGMGAEGFEPILLA